MSNGERVSFRCFFSLLWLKSSFPWNIPEPSLQPYKEITPTARSLTPSSKTLELGRSHRGGSSNSRCCQGQPRLGIAVALGVSQISSFSLLSQGRMGQREVTTGQWAKMKKHPALSGMGWLPVETKAGSAVLKGRGLFQWAERTGPGVAKAVVSVTPALVNSWGLHAMLSSVSWINRSPTCANYSSFPNSAHDRAVPTKCQGPGPTWSHPPGRLQLDTVRQRWVPQNTHIGTAWTQNRRCIFGSILGKRCENRTQTQSLFEEACFPQRRHSAVILNMIPGRQAHS